MADQKVTDLTAETSAGTTDVLYVVAGGTTSKKITFDNVQKSVDHNVLANTHNLTTNINHNTITNAHNLTTDLAPAWGNVSSRPSSTTADIDSAVSLKHTSGADTTLGSGAEAVDHGTGTTDMIINVCYGTSATPPTASGTTEGAVYLQYTA